MSCELKLWKPEKAVEHPEYSEIIIEELWKSFMNFFTVTNSKGGRHKPSFSVEINNIYD